MNTENLKVKAVTAAKRFLYRLGSPFVWAALVFMLLLSLLKDILLACLRRGGDIIEVTQLAGKAFVRGHKVSEEE